LAGRPDSCDCLTRREHPGPEGVQADARPTGRDDHEWTLGGKKVVRRTPTTTTGMIAAITPGCSGLQHQQSCAADEGESCDESHDAMT
jgi:hypothetical protein